MASSQQLQLQKHRTTTMNNSNQHHVPSIWEQMSYIPPRGPCSQKLTLLSSCPCYRFMIHPLKAPTSYDCDGCGHHASFHKFENPEEEQALARRWQASVSGGGGGESIEGGHDQREGQQEEHRRREQGLLEMDVKKGRGTSSGRRLVERIEEVEVEEAEDEEMVEVQLPVIGKRRLLTSRTVEVKPDALKNLDAQAEDSKRASATGRKRRGRVER